MPQCELFKNQAAKGIGMACPLSKQQQREILDHCYLYGHFHNPDHPNTWNVKPADLQQLDCNHPIAKEAVKSMEASDYNLEVFAEQQHGRALDINGEAGPAGYQLVRLQRCHVPDFPIPGRDHYGLEFAGTGGWMQCDPTREYEHEVVILFDDRGAPAHWKAYLGEVKQNAVDISADMGLAVRYVSPGATERWQSSVAFRPISGNVIGLYYLPRGSGCQQIPQGALDSTFLPDVHMASGLWIHEGAGHGVGLQHRSARRDSDGVLRGIMNPSLVRVPLTWRGDPSEGDMRGLYGGVPINLTPPNPPDPPGPKDPKVLYEFISSRVGQKFQVVEIDDGDGWSFDRR